MAEKLIKIEAPIENTDIHHLCTSPAGANCKRVYLLTFFSWEMSFVDKQRGPWVIVFASV